MNTDVWTAWAEWFKEAIREAESAREPRHPLPAPRRGIDRRPMPVNRRKRLFR